MSKRDRQRIRELEAEVGALRAQLLAVDAQSFAYRTLVEHFVALAAAAGVDAAEAQEVLRRPVVRPRHLKVAKG